jgi:hypothetical protein
MTEDETYHAICNIAEQNLSAAGTYEIGRSLMVLGLSQLYDREAELTALGPAILRGLEGLDAIRERKKQLNGHGRGLA